MDKKYEKNTRRSKSVIIYSASDKNCKANRFRSDSNTERHRSTANNANISYYLFHYCLAA